MVPRAPIRIKGIAAGKLRTGKITIPQADLLERALVNVKIVPSPMEMDSINPIKTPPCSSGHLFRKIKTANAQIHMIMEINQEYKSLPQIIVVAEAN